jgi:hypothetical protein
MAGNHLIIRANRLAYPSQLGSDLARMDCRISVVLQYLKTSGKTFHDMEFVIRPVRLSAP